MALLWAEKELEVNLYCVGEDHPGYKEMLDLVTNLRAEVTNAKLFVGSE